MTKLKQALSTMASALLLLALAGGSPSKSEDFNISATVAKQAVVAAVQGANSAADAVSTKKDATATALSANMANLADTTVDQTIRGTGLNGNGALAVTEQVVGITGQTTQALAGALAAGTADASATATNIGNAAIGTITQGIKK